MFVGLTLSFPNCTNCPGSRRMSDADKLRLLAAASMAKEGTVFPGSSSPTSVLANCATLPSIWVQVSNTAEKAPSDEIGC